MRWVDQKDIKHTYSNNNREHQFCQRTIAHSTPDIFIYYLYSIGFFTYLNGFFLSGALPLFVMVIDTGRVDKDWPDVKQCGSFIDGFFQSSDGQHDVLVDALEHHFFANSSRGRKFQESDFGRSQPA